MPTKRTGLNRTYDRATVREGGRVQTNRAQLGDSVARFADELATMSRGDLLREIARLVDAAEGRVRMRRARRAVRGAG